MKSRRSLSLVVALALVAAFAVQNVGGHTAPARAATGITFASPIVVDPVHTYGEPDIRIHTDGTIYASGPWGTGTQRSIWNRSINGGQSFQAMHDVPISSANESDTQITGPGGGDTEIAIQRNGKVFYSDLAALLTLKVATWNPATKQMPVDVLHRGDQNANGYDRQWFGLWDPPDRSAARAATGYKGPLPVNYLVFTEAVLGSDCSTPAVGMCHGAAYSTDGIDYSDTTTFIDDNNDGNVVVDQLSGTVFMATSQSNGGTQDDPADVSVAIFTRGSDPSDPALRKAKLVKVANLPVGEETGDTLPFPTLAIDAARNLYAVWVTRPTTDKDSVSEKPQDWQVYYSFARASTGWTTWSTPRHVNTSPANTNLFVWPVAGAAGRLAVAWLGTSDTTHNPSSEDAHQAWHVYLAMITNAASGTPTVQQTRVTRHPMHYGTICLEGLGCVAVQGNRNMADFFQVTMDPRDGAVAIVYNDTSNELIQEVPPLPDGTIDHRGASLVVISRQNGGVGLLGTTVHGPPTFGNELLPDQAGNARFDPLYGTNNVPQLDLLGLGVTRSGNNLVFKLHVKSLENLQNALAATGSQAVDYVVRWTGPPVNSPTGVRNPIYYAAAEVGPSGTPTFFAGTAQSIDLCSVSACFPHVLNYPAPPQGGTAVTGAVLLDPTDHDHMTISVPLSAIGSPAAGSLLESLSAYTFARNHSASLQITNAEAQAGILPIEVDGVCCTEATVPA